MRCPFCILPSQRIITETKYFNIIKPLYSVATTEILLISKRHISALVMLNSMEKKEIDIITNFYPTIRKNKLWFYLGAWESFIWT